MHAVTKVNIINTQKVYAQLVHNDKKTLKATAKHSDGHANLAPVQKQNRWALARKAHAGRQACSMTVNNANWQSMIDRYSGFKMLIFLESKNKIVEQTCMPFDKWKQNRKPVCILRMENVSEARLKKSKSTNWKLGIRVNIPQKSCHKIIPSIMILYVWSTRFMSWWVTQSYC